MLSEAEASIPPASVADSSTPLRSAQNDRSIGHSRGRGKMNFKTASQSCYLLSALLSVLLRLHPF